MKCTLRIFCILLYVMVTSCTSTDETDDLIGVWSAENITIDDGIVKVTGQDTIAFGSFTLSAKDISAVLILNQDRTMSSDGEYNAVYAYSLLEEEFTSESIQNDFGGRGNWSYGNEQIVIRQDDNVQTLNLLIHTEDRLELTFAFEDSFEGSDFLTELSGTIKYVLVK